MTSPIASRSLARVEEKTLTAVNGWDLTLAGIIEPVAGPRPSIVHLILEEGRAPRTGKKLSGG